MYYKNVKNYPMQLLLHVWGLHAFVYSHKYSTYLQISLVCIFKKTQKNSAVFILALVSFLHVPKAPFEMLPVDLKSDKFSKIKGWI
jgi:hypothetical protein